MHACLPHVVATSTASLRKITHARCARAIIIRYAKHAFRAIDANGDGELSEEVRRPSVHQPVQPAASTAGCVRNVVGDGAVVGVLGLSCGEEVRALLLRLCPLLHSLTRRGRNSGTVWACTRSTSSTACAQLSRGTSSLCTRCASKEALLLLLLLLLLL